VLSHSTYAPTVLPTQQYNPSGGITTFQILPSSLSTATDRNILIKYFVQVAIAATASTSGTGNLVDIGLYDAPRAFPLSQCITNISIEINGQGVSLNLYYCVNAFTRLNFKAHQFARNLSTCPSSLDEFQDYNGWQNGGGGFAYTGYLNGTMVSNTKGAVCDPLQAYGQGDSRRLPNRGGYPMSIIGSGVTTLLGTTTVNAVGQGNAGITAVQFISMEPFWVSPFDAIATDYSFMGISSINVTINFQNLNRVWCHNGAVNLPNSVAPIAGTRGNPNASTFTNMAVTFFQAPECHVLYMNPSLAIPVPNTLLYPFSNCQILNDAGTTQTVAPGGQFTMNSQVIQFNSIPSRVVIWAERTQNSKDVNTTDTFANLQNISITYDTQQGILSSATTEDLYWQSVNNGLDMSLTQWLTTTGSVFILDWGKNMSINKADEAPGVEVTKNFQYRATFVNINPVETIQFTLYTMWISNGTMTITRGTSINQTAPLTKMDVIKNVEKLEGAIPMGVSNGGVPPAEGIDLGAMPSQGSSLMSTHGGYKIMGQGDNYYGGKITLKGIVNGLKKGVNYLGEVHNEIKKFQPLSKGVAAMNALAPLTGYQAPEYLHQLAANTGYGMGLRNNNNSDSDSDFDSEDDDNNDNNNNNNNNNNRGGALISKSNLYKRSRQNQEEESPFNLH
jgi:hypothetical protein